MLAMRYSLPPFFPPLHAYFVAWASKYDKVLRARIERKLQNLPDSELRSGSNTIFQTCQLSSITFKGSKFVLAGSLITPDVTFETQDGKKKKFGIEGPDLENAWNRMYLLYPNLCKAV